MALDGSAAVNIFRRNRRPLKGGPEDERVQAREKMARIDERIQKLRDESAVITITLPKVKRARQ